MIFLSMLKNERKHIINIFIFLCFLLSLQITAMAADLPIDIEVITTLDELQREAVAARRGIDVFSETAHETSEALTLIREASRDKIMDSFFSIPINDNDVDKDIQVLNAAADLRLFSAPMQTGRGVQIEEETDFPVWLIILIFTCATGIGVLLAVIKTTKKRARVNNVHNDNS